MPPIRHTRVRSGSSELLRNGDGTFQKMCSCTLHTCSIITAPLINIPKGKKISKKTYNFMTEHGLISKYSKYICKDCMNLITHKIEQKKSKKTESNVSYSEFKTEYSCSQDNAQDNAFPQQHLSDLEIAMKSDVKQLYKDSEKCNIDSLLTYNAEEWLSQRPPFLVGLLRKLCGFPPKTDSSQTFQLAKCVEHIYGCRNRNLILPISFQENLLVYSLSRNKQLVTYNAKTQPSGGIDTINKWMTEQARDPVPFPEGTVRCVFDNEQVIGKNYKVKTNSSAPTSIITSHMYIKIDEMNDIQNCAEFAPAKWLFNEPDENQTREFLLDTKSCHTDVFRDTRNKWISERLIEVEKNFTEKGDIVDEIIRKKTTLKVEKACVECGAENDRNSRKCTNCGGGLITESFNYSAYRKNIDPYSSFNQIDSCPNKITVMTGEPDMCNPASFENISTILFNIADRAGIYSNSSKKWVFLECDGGIYTIVEKLMFNTYICPKCGQAYYGREQFHEHRCSILHSVEPAYQFGWLMPLPGLLHVEMNACKAFFDLNWDVFLNSVCSQLGFKTPRALECVKKCYDHHKTFKIIEILYVALTDELLTSFIRYAKSQNVPPSTDGYWTWSENVVDPNYLYIQQMTFTFLHSIMLFRTGMRRGNTLPLLAGREKLALLFYGRNHTRYQRIMAVNRYIEVMMPDKIYDIVQSSLTLSRTGNDGHYQGGDACLEEINKEAKSWVSPIGVPSQKEWQKVFRNLDNLTQLKKHFLECATGGSADNEKSRTTSPQHSVDNEEVLAVRELFRRHEYLLSPNEVKQHCSVNQDTSLSDELFNFTSEATALRKAYHRNFLNKEHTRLPTVAITQDEKAKASTIDCKTKQEIQREIFLLLEEVDDSNAKLMEDLFNKTVKGKEKRMYVEFYNTLKEDT